MIRFATTFSIGEIGRETDIYRRYLSDIVNYLATFIPGHIIIITHPRVNKVCIFTVYFFFSNYF